MQILQISYFFACTFAMLFVCCSICVSKDFSLPFFLVYRLFVDVRILIALILNCTSDFNSKIFLSIFIIQYYRFNLQPDLAGYEETPVELFGEAMLRGMGWNKGEAIGGKNKGYHSLSIIFFSVGLKLNRCISLIARINFAPDD